MRQTPPDGSQFVEHGLEFGADVVRGQKTGHFLDQRDNRVRAGTFAARRHVLDVFSCTGGFSVHSAAGGARAVTSVDLNGHALATAERQHAPQPIAPRRRRLLTSARSRPMPSSPSSSSVASTSRSTS